MARHYSPKTFLRQAPNRLLERYFQERRLLGEVDFAAIAETKIDPIFEVWQNLSSEIHGKVENDFRDIHALSCEGGVKVIIEESQFHGDDLGPVFAEMAGFYDKAFWTFLERKPIFDIALQFFDADNLPSRYWQKRKDLPRVHAATDADSKIKLQSAISSFFHQKEGRGRSCLVETYERGELDYFFVYPEDYSKTSIEWEKDEFTRRPHKPAFEIIFVYSRLEGTLDIFFQGIKKVVRDLQLVFAEAVLKTKIDADEKKDTKIYELNKLKDRDFSFIYDPSSGIEEVLIKKLRFTVFAGEPRRITLETDPRRNHGAIYDLMEDVFRIDELSEGKGKGKIPLSWVNVTQAGIVVVFIPDNRRGLNRRIFNISYPNSCSLKHEGRDLIIRKMLTDSGLESIGIADKEVPVV